MAVKDKVSWKFLVIISGIVVILWIASGLLLYGCEERGTFGDMFGAINSLFSGLAFAGVIYAIILQRKELQLQREELEATRKELAGQKEQLELQNSTLTKQNFEDTFFQLLRMHNEMVTSIIFVHASPSKGRDCFKHYYRAYLKDNWDKYFNENKDGFLDKDDYARITAVYTKFHNQQRGGVGHYFDSLCNLLDFIDRSEIEDKPLYAKFVRTQISVFETVVLFYHCCSKYCNSRLKVLAKSYRLFEFFPEDLLLLSDHDLLLHKFNE